MILWSAMFLYKHNEKRYLVVRTFMLGALMVLPLLIYRTLWDFVPGISLVETLKQFETKALFTVPLNLIFFYITVGVIEEYLKNRVVRGVDKKEITTIDDAIEFSIIAALGFSFAENTYYFIQAWINLGSDLLLQIIAFRSIFSSFAHVLFSTLYGYHFGLALFASPMYKKKKPWLTTILHKITRVKADKIYKEEQMFTGLFYAAALHAVFNILLGIGYTGFLIPFLIVGLIHVIFLISSKDNHVKYLTK